MPPPPKYEQVHTINDDIYLSLLGKGWRPTTKTQLIVIFMLSILLSAPTKLTPMDNAQHSKNKSIAVFILSILLSAQTKLLPMDNARHSQNKPDRHQNDQVYHDDNIVSKIECYSVALIYKPLESLGPSITVGLVAGINIATFACRQIGTRQDKLIDLWIKRKTINTAFA